jgi:hypothetical protein
MVLCAGVRPCSERRPECRRRVRSYYGGDENNNRPAPEHCQRTFTNAGLRQEKSRGQRPPTRPYDTVGNLGRADGDGPMTDVDTPPTRPVDLTHALTFCYACIRASTALRPPGSTSVPTFRAINSVCRPCEATCCTAPRSRCAPRRRVPSWPTSRHWPRAFATISDTAHRAGAVQCHPANRLGLESRRRRRCARSLRRNCTQIFRLIFCGLRQGTGAISRLTDSRRESKSKLRAWST